MDGKSFVGAPVNTPVAAYPDAREPLCGVFAAGEAGIDVSVEIICSDPVTIALGSSI